MPYIKIWLHLVWSTKNRYPFLTSKLRPKIFQHIKENALSKGIHLDFINGYTDHVHCLVSLTQEQTVAKIVQLIKGESTFWINQHQMCDNHFEWQREYFAMSVSESGVDKVREYIKNQEAHHAEKSFDDEYKLILERYYFNDPWPEGHGKS